MAQHGKGTGIVIGEYDITRMCHEVGGDHAIETAEATAFDSPDYAKEYVVGLNDATFSWSGREQGSVDNLRARFGGIADLEAGTPFAVAFGGFNLGRLCELGDVYVTSLNLSSPVSDVVSASGDLQSDGPVAVGYVLSTKAALTASATGTPILLTTAAVAARVQYHIVENGRDGTTTLTVQHSDDGSVWVDYDELQIASGLVVGEAHEISEPLDQYVRLVSGLAGSTGQVTVRVAIARKGA